MFDTPEKIKAAIERGLLDAETGNRMLNQFPNQGVGPDPYTVSEADRGRAIYQNFATRNIPSQVVLNTQGSYLGTTYPGLESQNNYPGTTYPGLEIQSSIPQLFGQASQNPNIDSRGRLIQRNQTQDGLQGSSIARGSEEQIANLVAQGYTQDEATQLANSTNYDSAGRNLGASYGENYDAYIQNQNGTQSSTLGQRGPTPFPFIYSGGIDLGTKAYMLGNAIGAQPGTRGRGLGIAAGSAGLALGLAGNIAAGIGLNKQQKITQDYYNKKLYGRSESDYIPASQTLDSNYRGEIPYKYGGTAYFEDGGQMAQEALNPNMEQQEQSQEAGEQQNDQTQQVMNQVAQMLQQGVNPQQILQQLMQFGIDQQQAAQMIQAVIQQLQRQQVLNTVQSAQEEQQEQITGGQNMQEEIIEGPKMKCGGTFKHKVGDTIRFSYGGVMKEGKISKIENGKIYL